jgi:hypothetical protein
MQVRWLPIVLILSLAANVGLALGWLGQVVSEGVLASDTGSSFRLMALERAQLQAMREHFCPHDPSPSRAALLQWEENAQAPEWMSGPFDKDGLLWLGVSGVGIKFDAEERLIGVCLPQAWGLLEEAKLRDLDRAGELCPLEPLC